MQRRLASLWVAYSEQFAITKEVLIPRGVLSELLGFVSR